MEHPPHEVIPHIDFYCVGLVGKEDNKTTISINRNVRRFPKLGSHVHQDVNALPNAEAGRSFQFKVNGFGSQPF
jgi:hypothetical protein